MPPTESDAEKALWSVEETFAAVVGDTAAISGGETIALADAAGRVTSAAVTSPIALPRFDQSAMDGYGVHAADLDAGGLGPFPVSDRIKAGEAPSLALRRGTTVRILTGAAIPPGVGAVVMEERVERLQSGVRLRVAPKLGENIRRLGEDLAAGALLVAAGIRLDARHLALLAAAGLTELAVVRRLRVGILSIGDELVDPGAPLSPTAVNDSNRPMLRAVLASSSAETADLGRLADDEATIAARLAGVASDFDLVVTTGGVSGSDADHVVEAIRAAGGRATRVSLAMKPGKPMAYGTIGSCRMLALAGNPVSALVGALLFGRPLARRLSGEAARPATGLGVRAAADFPHRKGRREFVPAAIVGRDSDGWTLVERRGHGGSAKISPLLSADGFAVVPATADDLKAGECVEFLPFRTDFAL